MTLLNSENLPLAIPTDDVQLRARVILSSDDVQKLTFRREASTRTALARALADYLEPTEIDWAGGRKLRFIEFNQTWAEPEDPALYPAATLVAAMDAVYDASTFTPVTTKIDDGTDRYVQLVAELRQEFSLVIWTTDPQERDGLTAAIEDAMEPAEFMTGLRLEIPYYFGVRATYEKTNMVFDDDAESAQRRWRRTVMTIVGNIPQVRPVGQLPTMRPQERVTVVDPTAC